MTNSTATVSRRRFIIATLSSLAAFLCPDATAEGAADSGDAADRFMKEKGFSRYPNPGRHRVYTAGKGPAVLVLHEITGPCNEDIRLACNIANSGFTAVFPVFFGMPGQNHSTRNLITQCFVPFTQFHCWIPGVTTRAANWLGKLVPELHRQCGGKGVGIIGMCLTGSLPLALLKEERVKAAVLCQPTNPFLWKRHLDISERDLKAAIDRKDVLILGLKFSGDGKSPHQRFDTLHRKFQGHFSEIIINTGPEGAPLNNQEQHSVLGVHYNQGKTAEATQETFSRVLRYLDERLSATPTRLPYPGSTPVSPNDCPPDKFTSCASY